MNNDVMFSSKSDEWSTPQSFFDALDAEFHFDLDACGNADNHKCERYFSREQDGLSADWGGQGCFAIHHIQKLKSGLQRRSMKGRKMTLLLSC